MQSHDLGRHAWIGDGRTEVALREVTGGRRCRLLALGGVCVLSPLFAELNDEGAVEGLDSAARLSPKLQHLSR
jgi:hypothetical protein